jgi:hypothetical protein
MCRIMVVHCFACEVMGYLFFARNIASGSLASTKYPLIEPLQVMTCCHPDTIRCQSYHLNRYEVCGSGGFSSIITPFPI